MDRRRAGLSLVALLACSIALPQAQQAAPAAPVLTPAQMEAFLLQPQWSGAHEQQRRHWRHPGHALGRDARARGADQSVDEKRLLFQAGAKSEVNFKDTYRFNIRRLPAATCSA